MCFVHRIVITSTVTIVTYFSNDTKGSFDETSAAFSSTGVPVVYLAATHVLSSGVMDVSHGGDYYVFEPCERYA